MLPSDTSSVAWRAFRTAGAFRSHWIFNCPLSSDTASATAGSGSLGITALPLARTGGSQ